MPLGVGGSIQRMKMCSLRTSPVMMKFRPSNVYTVAIILLFLCSLNVLHREGKASRVFERVYSLSEATIPAYMLNRSSDLYSLWKKKGLRGRILLHLGRFFHFVSPENPLPLEGISDFKEARERARRGDEANVNVRNFLRVAVEQEIAREVYHLLPRSSFGQLLERARAEERDDEGIITSYYGLKRVITDRIPHLHEPVLLNIDASFFESSDVAAIAAELKESGLKVDLLTLCLSEDNPGVSTVERERLREFSMVFRRL